MLRIIISILIGTILGLSLIYVVDRAGFDPTPVYPYYPTPIYLIILLMPALSGALIGYAWDCIRSIRSRQLLRDTESRQAAGIEKLPASVTGFIAEVMNKMGYHRRVRRDVELELICYFNDARAQTLIEQFGDPRFLAKLIRRAKKRCRPIWKKTLIRSFQVTALLLVLCVLRLGSLSIGTTNISTDYVQWLNDLVKQNRGDSLNAKPYYDKAINHFYPGMDPFHKGFAHTWPEQWSPQQKIIVKKILQENGEPLEWLRKGTDKPYYWRVYEKPPREDDSIPNMKHVKPRLPGGIVTQHLPGGRSFLSLGNEITPRLSDRHHYSDLARILILEIKMNAASGNINKAVTNSMVLQKFGMHQQGKGYFIEQMVGVTIEALSIQNIFQLLNIFDVPDGILKNTQLELERLYNQNTRPIYLEAELTSVHDFVQRSFTDDGKGNGRMLKGGISFMTMGDNKELLKGLFLGFPDRREVLTMIESFYQYSINQSERTPWQLHSQPSEYKNGDSNIKPTLLLQALGYTLIQAGQTAWKLKASRGALLTVIALKRWKLQEGEYPDSLSDLVEAGFLKELPIDPYQEGPLTYKKQGDDFILYSYAGDFEDDSGQQTHKNPWAENEESGDRVFWPLGTPDPTSTILWPPVKLWQPVK